MQNPENPPSNPELLRLLSKQIAAMKFDMRAFLREIALSNAYQRAFDPPGDLSSLADRAVKEATDLKARRDALAKASEASSKSYAKASEVWEDLEAKAIPAETELDTAKTKYADAKKKMDEATKAAADVEVQLKAKKTAMAPVEKAATAAQAAVKALPADKELADAAAKFANRAKQLKTETATLTKTATEKTAAIAPVTDAWNKTKPPVEAAKQKVVPLTALLKDAEKVMLAARDKAADDKELLESVERRLATAEEVVKVHQLKQAIAAAEQAVPARAAALASAEKLLAEYLPIAAERDKLAKSAGEAATAAAKSLDAAQAPLKKQAEAVASLAVAAQAAAAARQKLPENAALGDIVKKLEVCRQEANAKQTELQKPVDAAAAARKAADEKVVAVQESLAGVLRERAKREQALAAAKTALAAAKADVGTKKSQLDATKSDLNDRWSHDFTIASLKPLTPEQMCWSVFQVTGVYDRYWQTEAKELDKKKPLTEEQKKDPKQIEARNIELEQRTYDKLKSNVATFVAFYGAVAGQPQSDFFATADQALFVANGGSINTWVAPAAGNVSERVANQKDVKAAADDLYLGVLTRLPTDAERADVEKFLTTRSKDRKTAAQELVWALLNSAEFRFNH
jgi:hypothetical protein